ACSACRRSRARRSTPGPDCRGRRPSRCRPSCASNADRARRSARRRRVASTKRPGTRCVAPSGTSIRVAWRDGIGLARRPCIMPKSAVALAVKAITPIAAESLAAARDAGLRYVNDAEPGIRREETALGFRYRAPDGRPVRDREALRRIRNLVVPPAWRDVWICPSPDGHIQATARDARGRKQYRYHPRWRAVRDEAKYGRLRA